MEHQSLSPTLYDQYVTTKRKLRQLSNKSEGHPSSLCTESTSVNDGGHIETVFSDNQYHFAPQVAEEIQKKNKELTRQERELNESIRLAGLRRGREVTLINQVSDLHNKHSILLDVYQKEAHKCMEKVKIINQELNRDIETKATLKNTVLALVGLQNKMTNGLKSLCVDVETSRRQVCNEIEAMKDKISSLHINVQRCEESNEFLVKEHQVRFQSLKEEKDTMQHELSTQLVQLTTNNQNLAQNIDSYQVTISSLQSKLKSETESKLNIMEKLELVQNEQKYMKNARSDLEHKLKTMCNEKDRVLETLAKNRDQYYNERHKELEDVETRVKGIMKKKSEEVRIAIDRADAAEAKAQQMKGILDDLEHDLEYVRVKDT